VLDLLSILACFPYTLAMNEHTTPHLPPKSVRKARAHAGGVARREALTPEERSRSARKAAQDRWAKTPKTGRSEAARQAVMKRWRKAKRRKPRPPKEST